MNIDIWNKQPRYKVTLSCFLAYLTHPTLFFPRSITYESPLKILKSLLLFLILSRSYCPRDWEADSQLSLSSAHILPCDIPELASLWAITITYQSLIPGQASLFVGHLLSAYMNMVVLFVTTITYLCQHHMSSCQRLSLLWIMKLSWRNIYSCSWGKYTPS